MTCSRRLAWYLSMALAFIAAGCGGEGSAASGTFYPVKGKVIGTDSKPLGGVNVVFTGPFLAIARTESNGTFAVQGAEKKGLPAGDYLIRLEGTGSKGSKRSALPFPSRYTDEDASGLTAKVTPEGPNDFAFKLTRDDSGPGGNPRRAGK